MGPSGVAAENPTFPVAHLYLAQAYWGKGMYPQAIEEWKTFASSMAIRTKWNLPPRWTRVTRPEAGKRLSRGRIAVRLAQRKNSYASPYLIAQLYAQAGDKEQAFYWLDTAYRERDSLYQLKTDFMLDPLRSDPRFAELVKRVGLPQ